MFWSLVVHGLALLGLVIAPSFLKKPPRFDNSIRVQLAPALPVQSAAPAPAQPTPPAPEVEQPKAPPEGVSVATKEPVKTDKAPPKDVKPIEKPAPVKPNPQPVAPAPATESGSEPVGGPGASVAAMEGGDSRLGWYRSSVTAKLYSNWQRPLLKGMTEELQVQIVFEIQRDGSVRGLRIAQPSGVPLLDRSALRAVSDALPLPALPASWREPGLPASFVFRLYPEDY